MKSFILTLTIFLWSFHAFAKAENIDFVATMTEYANYCQQSGGMVETLPIEVDNGMNQGRLAQPFCIFQWDNQRAIIGLETFASMTPSIASTYLKTLSEISSDSPLWGHKPGSSAVDVCKNLGGVPLFIDFGQPIFGDSGMCVFKDMSIVSSRTLINVANHDTGYDEIRNNIRAEPKNN